MPDSQSGHIQIPPLILFGGTFDPIHIGHMAIAQKLYEVFNQPVTFLPTAVPLYKPQPLTTSIQRLDMLKLALAEHPHFLIDTREILLNNFCSTYQTITGIRDQIGNQIPINFAIGSDSLETLDTWQNWQQLLDLANFVVIRRPWYNLDKMSTELRHEYDKRIVLDLEPLSLKHGGLIYTLDLIPPNISSTKIRQLILEKHEITNMVPETVLNYILRKRLY